MPQMREQPQSGLGSGVIISADGYIVTNNHVVDGADSVTVTLDDGRILKARVVGRDPQTDIAVVKVDGKDLPAIKFAESAKSRGRRPRARHRQSFRHRAKPSPPALSAPRVGARTWPRL